MDFTEYDEDSEMVEDSNDTEDLPDVADEELDNEQDRRSFLENLEDSELFDKYKEGEYNYAENIAGKSAWGNLDIADEGVRNAYAQRVAGGEFREDTDDGGHLIGTRFGGSPELENIDAQNRNLNRGGYKKLENEWASRLENGDKIFLNVDTYKSGESDRPSAYMGYIITEDPEGKRDWDTFSYTNVSKEEQAEWEQIDRESEE